MNRPRLLIADDHDEMRYLLRGLLASDYDVVAEAADGLTAVPTPLNCKTLDLT